MGVLVGSLGAGGFVADLVEEGEEGGHVYAARCTGSSELHIVLDCCGRWLALELGKSVWRIRKYLHIEMP